MAVPEPPAGRPRQGPASSLPATLAARVEEIVHAAEREAGVIQRDLEVHRSASEAEAQRYLDEAKRQADALVHRRVQRMRELTDELVERAEATRGQFDGLIGALERATARLAREQNVEGGRPEQLSTPTAEGEEAAEPAWVEPPAASRRALRRRRPPFERRAGEGGEDGEDRDQGPEAVSAASLEAARLVAIEMAVAGRTRDEVDAHLRESFRITDTPALLDDVFGGGDGETIRTAWVTP